MHVMDGECEKTTNCLAAEGAPEVEGIIEKNGGGDLVNSDCQDSLLGNAKSLITKEQIPVNGEHIESPKGEVEEEGAEEDCKEQDNDSEEQCRETELLPDLSIENDLEEEKANEVDMGSEIADGQEVLNSCEKENTPEDLEKVEDLSKGSDKEEIPIPEKPAASPGKEVKEEKEEICAGSEEEDRQSVSSSQVSQNGTERRKRSLEREAEAEVSSGSESEGGRKRIKQEGEVLTPEVSQESQGAFEDERERVIRDFVEGCSQNLEDLSHSIEKLQKELTSLTELAKAKELEWNSLLRLRKLKEEMLERMLRKKRQTLVLETNSVDWNAEIVNQRNSKSHCGNNQLMMVPIVSSSPGSGGPSSHGVSTIPPVRIPEIGRQQRPILPKPYSHVMDPANVVREGRNGPILDVKSIIADYRSRHPENVPRRGRRVRGDVTAGSRLATSPALISMANMALGSGSSVRTAQVPPYSLERWASFAAQDPGSQGVDSSRSSQPPVAGGESSGMSFKDVLVQFAKLSQGPNPVGKPPPPYPEVTLHPVSSPQSPPTSHTSLLHGILTKSTPPAPPHRSTAFSPTLARLLTAPERPVPSHQLPQPQVLPQFRPPASRVSITDILTTSKKSRNEITITPVAGHPGSKSKDEVVLLDDDDETGSGDRLVIDEGGDAGTGSDEVPQCQGCRQKSAQFVCAGCGNQWYCSRECQVTAWEEHSDVCSG